MHTALAMVFNLVNRHGIVAAEFPLGLLLVGDLVPPFVQELSKETFARYRSMQCGVNIGGSRGPSPHLSRRTFVKNTYYGLSCFTWSVFAFPSI